MRDIERTLVEYRPDIKYATDIRNNVERKIFSAPTDESVNKERYITHKTTVLSELEMYPPSDSIARFQTLRNEMAKLREIKENILNVNKDNDDFGVPDDVPGSVDPHIVDLIDKIDDQVKFIEDQIIYFYDTEPDDDELDKVKKKEDQRLEEDLAREREDLTQIRDYELSPIENKHIDTLIYDPSSNINSVDDYINSLLRDRIQKGSQYIDYTQMADDVKISFLLYTEVSQAMNSLQSVNNIYNYTMNDAMMGSTQKGLEFLVEYAGQLYPIKEITSLQYKKENRDILSIQTNMTRHNDLDFRYALFENLKKFKDLRDRYKNSGLVTQSIEGNEASVPFATVLNAGKSAVDSQWENTVVEMMGSSQTFMKQISAITDSLEKQKHYSLLYRFSDIVSREFDFEYKERELNTFVRRFNIDSMR